MEVPTSPRRAIRRPRGGSALVFGALALVSIFGLRRADAAHGPARLAAPALTAPEARVAAGAFGRSGGVRMRFALPGARVDFPIEVEEAPDRLGYEWVPVGADRAIDPAAALGGGVRAPQRPGFYRLTIVGDGGRRVMEGMTLGVLLPLGLKRGSAINGYRMGFYRGERRGRAEEAPEGFLEIGADHAALPLSEHLAVGDFLAHDGQTTWPRYAALDMRLLEKVELVLAEIESWRFGTARGPLVVDVRSGYRTPLHNRRVVRAADDSRHQYGDAADIAVDADRDGRLTRKDIRLVELAVELVEREHPDLVGGLGIYTRSAAPYAHIDARGTRARWRG